MALIFPWITCKLYVLLFMRTMAKGVAQQFSERWLSNLLTEHFNNSTRSMAAMNTAKWCKNASTSLTMGYGNMYLGLDTQILGWIM
jgi:hypothetical protein